KHIVRPATRHQDEGFESFVDAAEKRARKATATVTYINEPLRINVRARHEQIGAAPNVDVLLNVYSNLLLVQWRRVLHKTGMHRNMIEQDRNHSRVRQHNRLIQKLA